MQSPIAEQPGLLIRDSFRYSDTTLIIPPALIRSLSCFDGIRTEADLHAELRLSFHGPQIGQVSKQLREALSNAGFLMDETYARFKAMRHEEFAQTPVRLAAHVGTAYPADLEELREVMGQYLGGEALGSGFEMPSVLSADRASDRGLVGIAAPHVSPSGGWQSYRAAYSALTPDLKDRTFVILGTSHYGEPNRFGLTRKPYQTPYGTTEIDEALVDELESFPAVLREDYCHAIEHSIEFQVLFLQAIYGPNIRIVPILCGPLGSLADFTESESAGSGKVDEDVNRFLDKLGTIAVREGNRLFWILGVDMAHIGRRYGDALAAIAEEGQMATVKERDDRRITRINQGDANGFWEMVRGFEDDLRWCGASAFYAFLRALPESRGTLRRYEQWNIDEQSVVSFAGMAFTSAKCV